MLKIILVPLLFHSFVLQAKVSEEQFHFLVKEFVAFISPLQIEVGVNPIKGVVLKENPKFGAFSTNPILVHTGLIDSNYVSPEALILVLCHEVGHNIKVATSYTPNNVIYAFPHLLQDYFASYSCIIPFLQTSKLESNSIQIENIPFSLRSRCETNFEDEKSINICLRVVRASIDVTNGLYFEVFRSEYEQKNLPVPSVEREWLGPDDHLQARLITFINGIFKEKPFSGQNLPIMKNAF